MSFAPATSLARTASRPPRRRQVLALLAVVLVLHGLLLGALPRERLPSPRPGPLPAPVMWTRSVPAAPPQAAPAEPEPPPERPAAPTLQPGVMADAPVAPAAAAPVQTTAAATPTATPAAPATPTAATAATAPAAPAAPAAPVAPPYAEAAASTPAPTVVANAAPDADGDEPETAAAGGSAPPLYATRLPGPTQLRFQLRRGPQRGQALMQWQPGEDDRYTMSFDAAAGGRPLFEQRSTGRSGPHGLSPERFQDKRRGRSAQHASFDADAQRIAFSGRAPDLPLWAGAQDRLGWVVQLAGIVAAAAQPPEDVRLYVVGARGGAGPWTFTARGLQEVATPLGPVQALHYERAPAVLRDQRVETWLDPARGYWPVKLRFTPVLGGPPLELLLEEEPRRP
jgi:hypothetical protein